ncbi:Abi family protein [Rhodococcus sp. IEGM 1379]|uniref:Abi family protein n=1 Tax=Rhodococcus sp. IEGM 1379 TaxID=3047086 RepID=UPI0024B68B82|nr:Abi family protein [Rhodococcus sp. IEGM 1379]MDI9918360.1 Abi family protein [Rhodococcus sp. IEGM 1379]
MAKDTDDWVQRWLSPERFATYVRKAGGSRERALHLYEWNAQLSAAFLHDLAHLEVGLRNAYDRELLQACVGEDMHWTEPTTTGHLFPKHLRWDPVGQRDVDANSTPRGQISSARKQARNANGDTVVAGKVVAELMFGFWTFLTSDFHEKSLWVPYLHKAFPSGTDRAALHHALTALREFRNRVAHHEPILSAPESARRQIVYVTKLLSPEALAHLNDHSQVSTILAHKP